jgi:hypothetical protein
VSRFSSGLVQKLTCFIEASGTFDNSYFDNSYFDNSYFDNSYFDLVRLSFGLRSTKLNIALIQHNLGHGFCSNNVMFDKC